MEGIHSPEQFVHGEWDLDVRLHCTDCRDGGPEPGDSGLWPFRFRPGRARVVLTHPGHVQVTETVRIEPFHYT